MGQDEPLLSIMDASKKAKVSVALIERAIKNKLVIPIEKNQSYYFSSEQLQEWSHFDKIASLIQNRLQRNTNNEYRGAYIEAGHYSVRNCYILPFDKCWLVTDGGKARTSKDRMLSHHYYLAPCVRWAWDLGIIHPDDYHKCRFGMLTAELFRLRFRKGQSEEIPDYAMSEPWEKQEYRKILNPDSSRTSNHFCYEVDVIAPADGIIITRQGLGSDPSFAQHVKSAQKANDDRGFSFMIDHGQNELSQIAHVLARTVAVRPGQQIKQGQFLCKAGARHFMPHLHWGVWDHWHPLFSQSLPITISACLVYRNGLFVKEEKVWLERGMLVKNLSQPGQK